MAHAGVENARNTDRNAEMISFTDMTSFEIFVCLPCARILCGAGKIIEDPRKIHSTKSKPAKNSQYFSSKRTTSLPERRGLRQ